MCSSDLEYNESITEWNAKKDALAEVRRKGAEKQGMRVPKAPRFRRKTVRVSDVIEPTTEEDTDEVITKAAPVTHHVPSVMSVYQVHPDIRTALEKGDTSAVLKAMADAKGNPYYAALAQRLLDANVKSKIAYIDSEKVEALDHRDPQLLESLNRQLATLRTLVKAALPADKAQAISEALKSNNRDRILAAIQTIAFDPAFEPSELQQVHNTAVFFRDKFAWDAKYDPQEDTIILRKGAPLTNAVFLHEAVHAATVTAIRNPNSLKGDRRKGFDQLNELYTYASKHILNSPLFTDEIGRAHV